MARDIAEEAYSNAFAAKEIAIADHAFLMAAVENLAPLVPAEARTRLASVVQSLSDSDKFGELGQRSLSDLARSLMSPVG